MDDDTLEFLPALEMRRVPAGVVVVARCREQDVAGDVPLLAIALQGHRPLRRAVGEVGAQHLVAQIHAPGQIIVCDDLVQVIKDLVRIGDGIVGSPGLELIAEGVQVGIRPDARIAEQVPGAANGGTAVDDGKTSARLLGHQVMAQPDPGDAGTDDQHIDMAAQRLRGATLVERGDGHGALPLRA